MLKKKKLKMTDNNYLLKKLQNLFSLFSEKPELKCKDLHKILGILILKLFHRNPDGSVNDFLEKRRPFVAPSNLNASTWDIWWLVYKKHLLINSNLITLFKQWVPIALLIFLKNKMVKIFSIYYLFYLFRYMCKN